MRTSWEQVGLGIMRTPSPLKSTLGPQAQFYLLDFVYLSANSVKVFTISDNMEFSERAIVKQL